MKRELTEVYCGRAKGEDNSGAGPEPAGGSGWKERYHYPVSERQGTPLHGFSGGAGSTGYQDLPF